MDQHARQQQEAPVEVLKVSEFGEVYLAGLEDMIIVAPAKAGMIDYVTNMPPHTAVAPGVMIADQL